MCIVYVGSVYYGYLKHFVFISTFYIVKFNCLQYLKSVIMIAQTSLY